MYQCAKARLCRKVFPEELSASMDFSLILPEVPIGGILT